MPGNKHVVIALIVAPLLSLLAWWAVGRLAGEQPHAAVAGQVYRLLEKGSCRYPSGRCDLVNGDVSLDLRIKPVAASDELTLRSSMSLRGVAVAVVPPGADGPGDGPAPRRMRAVDDAGMLWRLALAAPLAEGDRLRLVAATAENRFTAEVSTRFGRARD